MSRCQQVGRPILRSLRQGPSLPPRSAALFSTTSGRRDDVVADSSASASEPPPPPPPPRKPIDEEWRQRRLDPNTTTLRWAEKKLIKAGTPPVGSRRRRVAIRTSADIPFEQLPYQAFQEARKVLQADRQEKLDKIVAATARLRFLEQTDPATLQGAEAAKARRRIDSTKKYLDELKILADINDPLVKRRFEDGLGDMSKPIYRHLADRRWRAMDRKITAQRISQFSIVPDLLPKFEPTAEVKLFFRGEKVAPGTILDSRITEVPPSLRVQVFDRGSRFLTVAVVDADVPDPDSDTFSRRLHFLAANVPWDPARTSLPLSRVGAGPGAVGGDVPVPWLPPFAQKGSPYHRLAVFVLEHADPVDAAGLAELYGGRDGFALASLRNKTRATPVGFTMFRAVWDEGTAEVMARHGIPGADVELRPRRYESLKPHRKARGWEAKRQGPKYKFLERYTKRIA